MSSEKPKAHSATRHYKPVLAESSDQNREVVIRSFLTSGDIIELISVEDARTKDDAYIQGIRDEILGKPPFHGNYARKMGLIHIASRRVSHESNDVLYRHTGPKKVRNELSLNNEGKPIYFPRVYILRMISDEERSKEPDERSVYRKKVLNTIAHILHQHDVNRVGTTASAANSPSRRSFSPTKYNVPGVGWDMTPERLHPLDWYLTDQKVASTIQSIYIEEEVGGWRMFQENVPDADCFFSPPYTYVAKTFGFRNPNESSVREPKRDEGNPAVIQAFDAEDVVSLDS